MRVQHRFLQNYDVIGVLKVACHTRNNAHACGVIHPRHFLWTGGVLRWPVVGTAKLVQYPGRYRERDRDAMELEQKLARTELDALRCLAIAGGCR